MKEKLDSYSLAGKIVFEVWIDVLVKDNAHLAEMTEPIFIT